MANQIKDNIFIKLHSKLFLLKINLNKMSIPGWLITLIKNALVTVGKWGAKQLCKKFMGDETCGGFLN